MSAFENLDQIQHEIINFVNRPNKNEPTIPPWVGSFWNEQFAEIPDLMPYGLCQKTNSDNFFVAWIDSVPDKQTIRTVVEFRPEAKEIMEAWKTVWDRSFPGWQNAPEWKKIKSEVSRREYYNARLAEYISAEKRYSANRADTLSRRASFWERIEDYDKDIIDDYRDYRLHIIDCANWIVALKKAKSNTAYVRIHNHRLQLVDHDADGIPILAHVEMNNDFTAKRFENDLKYWEWPVFRNHMERKTIVTKDIESMGAVFADMAWQGQTHAFVKSCKPKKGTWTVSLDGVRTISDGVKLANAQLSAWDVKPQNESFMIQEHIPFTHEQRYFVMDGKIVASVCSDRNFCVTDNDRGRRLDERVAVLKTPSIDNGPFDRGKTTYVRDRSLSAKFARKARNIVRDLKGHGIEDYVVDIGLTERGVCAIEINGLHSSGPYCLNAERMIEAFELRRANFANRFEKKVEKAIEEVIDDDKILSLMKSLNTTKTRTMFLKQFENDERATSIELVNAMTEKLFQKALAVLQIAELNAA